MGGAIAERLAAAGARIVLNDRVADRVDAHRAAVEAHGVRLSVPRARRARTAPRPSSRRPSRPGGGSMSWSTRSAGSRGRCRSPSGRSPTSSGTPPSPSASRRLSCAPGRPPGHDGRGRQDRNIASTSWAPPDSALHPHYAAAKAGVVAFTRAVALSWRPMTQRQRRRPGRNATQRRRRVDDADAGRPPPLGRINDPADIAGAVAYLVSPDARNVSGQLHRRGRTEPSTLTPGTGRLTRRYFSSGASLAHPVWMCLATAFSWHAARSSPRNRQRPPGRHRPCPAHLARDLRGRAVIEVYPAACAARASAASPGPLARTGASVPCTMCRRYESS